MCGGEGSRLDAPVEKPLFEVDGVAMVDRVLAALEESDVDAVHAVVSPAAPDTAAHLRAAGVSTVETPGEGYVADLSRALDAVSPPVLTAAADLPLLSGDAVNAVLEAHDAGSLSVCVPASLKEALSVSADTTFERDGRALAPAGVNVVSEGDAEETWVTWDARFAVNVNRAPDARVAETLRAGRPDH